MRALNDNFVEEFKKGGCYNDLLKLVIQDADLDLQIRESRINIYYKGNSILQLKENHTCEIHQKFTQNIPYQLQGKFDLQKYLSALPIIKENVIATKSKRPTLEIEYEQLMIRSNNNVNSDIIITDRQFADNKSRFDLTGIYWVQPRKRGQTVPLAFIEVKYGLNNDIQHLPSQIDRYYDTVRSKVSEIAEETEYILEIKADLGLYSHKEPEALKSLNVSRNIDDAVFIIALIDFNPKSQLLNRCNFDSLPFSKQIKMFKCGLAIWKDYLK
ncbi:MAG: hypothetical protein JXB49_00895 [Bacteroidales bacterium]|nr:hypothetical protein [Bacteroidales bacterium]